MSVKEVVKKIKTLGTAKANKSNNIPIKKPKENAEIFVDYTFPIFEKCIDTSTFSNVLKHVKVACVVNTKLFFHELILL